MTVSSPRLSSEQLQVMSSPPFLNSTSNPITITNTVFSGAAATSVEIQKYDCTSVVTDFQGIRDIPGNPDISGTGVGQP